jgi:acyl-CoA thioester hydrolase
MQWCLDIAEEHWVEKASEKLREEYVWVVLNHFISYKAASFLNEEIEVQTWIDSYDGVKCDRHYKIIRLKDKKTLIEAKTLWCLLDGKSFRPKKITEEISNLFY